MVSQYDNLLKEAVGSLVYTWTAVCAAGCLPGGEGLSVNYRVGNLQKWGYLLHHCIFSQFGCVGWLGHLV